MLLGRSIYQSNILSECIVVEELAAAIYQCHHHRNAYEPRLSATFVFLMINRCCLAQILTLHILMLIWTLIQCGGGV